MAVDWSPELNGDTPETRAATTLEFYRAYREAVFLLKELGDTANATKYEARAEEIRKATQQYLLDGKTEILGYDLIYLSDVLRALGQEVGPWNRLPPRQ